LSSNSLYFIPECSHSLGYMLISVNPGIVFISFIYTLSVSFSTKKSTLESPLPSTALNALIAVLLISSIFSCDKSAGIITFDSAFLYFAS